MAHLGYRKLFALAVAWLTGLPGTGSGADEPVAHELGRSVYNFRCYFCHGYSGDARTLAAQFVTPPPRDFTATDPSLLSRDQMLDAVRNGRQGTAMQPFGGLLTAEEIAAVVDFVRSEFMLERRPNTRYHSVANGWYDHDRFAVAYPFATGELPLDAPPEALNERQRAGLKLYLSSCVSCHDAPRARQSEMIWEPRVVSYPRLSFKPGDADLQVDAVTGATPYVRHEVPPVLSEPSAEELQGEKLFQANCAFCHAADGTGRNWIGTFLEPRPRDLTDPAFMRGMTRERLQLVIEGGLPGTSMPAWRSVLSSPEIDAISAYIHKAFHPIAD